MTNDFIAYAAMLNECDIILTPDTVAVHLAAAFGKPVIALFQVPEPDILMPWYPLGTKCQCIENKHAIREIPVNQVLDAFRKLYTEIKV